MVSLEAGVKIELILDKDRDKNPQPKYFSKTVTGRRFRELMAFQRYIRDVATDKFDIADRTFETLEPLISGWENVVDPDTGESVCFAVEKLQDVLTVPEAIQLIGKAMTGNRLSEGERKNSE